MVSQQRFTWLAALSSILVVELLCARGASAAAVAPAPAGSPVSYTNRFSQQPLLQFPGGTYKASDTDTFPASTSTAGAFFNLTAGGLREPHWHTPDEWAYVITGTCRATLVADGKTHPVDSWDFQAGDIWYFPSNLGHSVLGLAPEGCTFIAAYNEGGFDERVNAKGLSNWLATAPPEIVAQALNISQSAVTSHIANGLDNFIAQGNVTALTAGQSDPPLLAARASAFGQAGLLQATPNPHRYPLAQGLLAEVNNSGGSIQVADMTQFPVSQNFAGAIVYAAPNSLRQMHWHVLADEWEYVINGSIELGVFNGSDQYAVSTLGAGDLGFAPKGIGHWIKTGPEGAYVVLIFNNGLFTDFELHNFVGNFPEEQLATTMGTSKAFVESWNVLGAANILPGSSGNYTTPASVFAAETPTAMPPATASTTTSG